MRTTTSMYQCQHQQYHQQPQQQHTTRNSSFIPISNHHYTALSVISYLQKDLRSPLNLTRIPCPLLARAPADLPPAQGASHPPRGGPVQQSKRPPDTDPKAQEDSSKGEVHGRYCGPVRRIGRRGKTEFEAVMSDFDVLVRRFRRSQ